jgi:hypothetical protein
MASGLSRAFNIKIPERKTNIIDSIFGTPADRLKRAELEAKEDLAYERLEQQAKRDDYKLFLQFEKSFPYLSDKRKIADGMGLDELVTAFDSAVDANVNKKEEQAIKDLALTKYDEGQGLKDVARLYSIIPKDSPNYKMATQAADKAIKSFGDVIISADERNKYQMNNSNLESLRKENVQIKQTLDNERNSITDPGTGELKALTEDELRASTITNLPEAFEELTDITYGKLEDMYIANNESILSTQKLVDDYTNKYNNKLQYVMDTYSPLLEQADLDFRAPDLEFDIDLLKAVDAPAPRKELDVDDEFDPWGDDSMKELTKLEISQIDDIPEARESLDAIESYLQMGKKEAGYGTVSKEVDNLISILKEEGSTDPDNMKIVQILDDIKATAQGSDFIFETLNKDRLKAEGLGSRKQLERKLKRQLGEGDDPFKFKINPKFNKVERLQKKLEKSDAITIQDVLELLEG